MLRCAARLQATRSDWFRVGACFCWTAPSRSKPAGIQAARKLRNHRREQRWAQKTYNKSHSITAMKANPFGGASMAKGIVLEKM